MGNVVELGGNIASSAGLIFGTGTGGGGTVATPTFSPAAGTYGTTQTVTISCSTPSSSIYYTTDGTTPTFPITGTTLLYTGSLTVSATKTIKAIGEAAGLSNSAVGVATYTISSLSANFFVSPTGADTNNGTSISTPWAITSLMNRSINANNLTNFGTTHGKTVFFMPGTYNVSTQMQSDSFTGAFQIDGGSAGNVTYYASCDSSGNYSVGTATITALTSGTNLPGGGLVSARGPILGGLTNTPHTGGYVTVDGLKFTAFCYKAIRIGGVSSGDGPAVTGDVAIKNCEFFGEAFNSGAPDDNCACIWMDGTATTTAGGTGNYSISNCYFHDNSPVTITDLQHLCAIFLFNCALVQITNNTGINAGTLAWGKDHANQGTTAAFNYVDNTASGSGTNATTLYGFSDFTGAFAPTTGLTLPSFFHNNIVVTRGFGMALWGAAEFEAWETPVSVFNNTVIYAGSGANQPAIIAVGQSTAAGQISVYNNIVTGFGSNFRGLIDVNALGIEVCDYNGEQTTNVWRICPQGGGDSGTTFSSQSTFAAAIVSGGGISGCESHSVFNNTPGFTSVNTGFVSSTYQLLGTSPFVGKGSTNGTTGGSACDIGAWGGASVPTQIGATIGP
jgi:hypothetical protein